ncbi:hypothetical protein PMAYCL1PPCAC_19290, partial [Pristionchus mayeri]
YDNLQMASSSSVVRTGDSAVVLEEADLTLLSLASAISTLDAQTIATRNSQATLNTAIEKLAEFLRVINDHEEPLDISTAIRKLDDSQRRVHQLSTRLVSLNERLGSLQRQIARETHQHKILIKQKLPEKPAQ